ncbi:MAG: hypothetical protein H8E44_03930 [Planctomycetes bacterium]|nr:hypothetical protein [Planctomycetota bacterium]MBL7037513.1 hypothetical protein [Pirellulaceae bacterium]
MTIGDIYVSCSERRKELKRRRQRKRKITHFKHRSENASVSEKAHLAAKIRNMTPGADAIIESLKLEER